MSERPGGQRVALSTVCLSGTLEDKLHAAAAAGFTGVEVLEYDLVMSSWSPGRLAEEAADLGLALEVYQPLHVETVPPELFEMSLRRAERKLDLAVELGARVLVCCSSRTTAGVDDEDLAAEQLRALADRAEQRGMRLAFEAVPWGRVRTHDEAWRLVRRVDHPALGLCLDSFHVLSLGDDPRTLADIDIDKVFHVQLADAPRPNMDVREWSLHYRMFPGQGSLDVAGFLAQILAMGYRGPMALEVFNDVYQQEDPRHAATDAMRSLLALAEAVRLRGAVDGADPLLIGDLPPAPELGGFAFAELAVDGVSAPLVSRALTALGFVHSGEHRSLPVQLWEQGPARVLLNLAPQRSITPATASISALAVESADPASAMRRAEMLLAPKLPRPRRPDESDLGSVAAPDGTALFFCGAGGRHGWLDDFRPTGASADGVPLLAAIDHVSITESIDDFDQSALFFRSVLGLVPGQSTEITAPFGLIRSWSASDPGGRVRVTLNTTPLRRGDWAPGVSSPQLVAFGTDDAIACAKAMRERGAPILQMPGNYYDDLDARLSLPADFLDALREHSILYDRNEQGEFLHFFTEMLGSRLFFEVVQRIDGYNAFGDPRSIPLRMAAHRRQRLRMLASAPTESSAEHRHDYSLAHLTALSLSPPELVDAAAAAGYRYVGLRMTRVTAEEPHYPLTYDPALMRATKTHLAATGIEVLDIELARFTSGDSPRDYLRFLEAGAELGARHVIAQLPDADFARKTDRFAELCELAAPLGLTVDLEFPSWTETPDLTEATRVLRAANQPNMGLLIDLLHFARSRSSIDDLRQLPPEWFHYAHVCDAPGEIPTTTAELIHTARFERLFPGEGDIDMQGILAALPAGIPYALEIPRAMLVAQVGAKEHTRLAIAAARRHLDAAAAVPVG
ncbi:TIM barrel protein [Microbacterium sp. CFBP9034]|uniref:TIM barrel protein n=1 Tax=Microbacterium sp. CFBP9034 TaxID=3096540 RepID=UPI002A6A41EF|nr:TIM barrel protein [Microbacterium sp. CFBP9034]MDY0908548.1 TIM barrel protein [Microbacterium sp. CFBP9034]